MKNSILIVDDDKYLVEKLEQTVQWEKLGIETVLTAYNIRQAKKILEEVQVQMLLSDIDMPQGSGLELVEWIRAENMDIECIFLSSYANFAYAQKALRLSTREYLLKPISNQDLEKVLFDISQVCTKKRMQEQDFLGEEGKENIWEKFFLENTDREVVLQKILQQGIYQEQDRCMVVLLRFFAYANETENQKNGVLSHLTLQNAASEFFNGKTLRFEELVRVKDCEWALVLLDNGEKTQKEELLRAFKKYLDQGMPSLKCMYISRSCQVAQMTATWENVKEMERQLLPGADGILFEGERQLFKDGKYEEPAWKIWQAELENGRQLEEVCKEICGYLADRYEKFTLTIKHLTFFLRELEVFVYYYLEKQQMTFARLFDNQEFEQKKQEAFLSFAGTEKFVCWIFETIAENLKYDQNREDVVERLKAYIESSLDKELSRSLLAKEVYLSEDYLSKLFKNATGMSIPNYIALRRIERAKEYLSHSNLPVCKIALEVGYSNFSYFSKTFRDMTGMTPNEYRVRMTKI